jgi:hypothetical protein
MDHGFFDGSWRGGASRYGTPFILTEAGKAWLAKRKAKAAEPTPTQSRDILGDG